MVPPFISYITHDRLALTAMNLPAILRSDEDFELHITDCNSKDDTWDYIMSLDDSRIKTKERIEVNHGKTYTLNLHLLRRSPEQYFFTVASDAYIDTDGWIGKYLKVFEAFGDVGLLGVMDPDGNLPPVSRRTKNSVTYLELNHNPSDAENTFIPDHCMCLRPELIKSIGYFSEENCFGAIELSYRVCHHTGFKAGFITDVHIQRPQTAACAGCAFSDRCTLDKAANTCFTKFSKVDKDGEYFKKFQWKFAETVRDMKSGARPVYCASILDGGSVREHIYNKDWALENFWFFISNAN